MDLWVIITVAAATVQTLRLLMQKRLKGLGLSTGGASFSRFFFNAPLIFGLLAARLFFRAHPCRAGRRCGSGAL
jgi:hypothetical protein